MLQMKWILVQRSGRRDNQVPLEKLQTVLAQLEGGIYMSAGRSEQLVEGRLKEDETWKCRQKPEHAAIFKDFILREIGSRCRVLSRGVL